MAESGTPPFVDTNVLVRYLTDDPPELAERAARVIESEAQLMVSELVLVEAAYVLTTVYEIPRASAVDARARMKARARRMSV